MLIINKERSNFYDNFSFKKNEIFRVCILFHALSSICNPLLHKIFKNITFQSFKGHCSIIFVHRVVIQIETRKVRGDKDAIEIS